jgi:hypothetical protein
MPLLRHLLVADVTTATPRRGETVVWLGAADRPPSLAGNHRVVRARTSADVVAVIDSGPAVLRFALRQPLGFVEALTIPPQVTEARAA